MNLKLRLIIMNFLEFAVWGAYLTCMGNYLGVAGLGAEISWFYAIQGIVSIFMPTLIGIVADKWIQPQRLLGICHLLAGTFMIMLWYMGMTAGFGNAVGNKALFITIYTLSVALLYAYVSTVEHYRFHHPEEQRRRHRHRLSAHPLLRYRRIHHYYALCQQRGVGQWLLHAHSGAERS